MKAVVFIYIFFFACLFKMHATQPHPKTQQQPKDCVKHPQIVKAQPEKAKIVAEKVVKSTTSYRGGTSIPHFSVLNFINFFYTKDTLDNLHVM
ncbi:MAG: hypothetical protein K0S53_1771 [Bacteroidetes bacterium]|jgi:hypothetical protein|nr:hypothetical protein [Bacteroidota bacterium]MDF2453815.1 hypothetical protein [Bacteroidota bacterium]